MGDSHGFVSDWMVTLGLMVGLMLVKFEEENLAGGAVLFCGTVVDWAGRTVDEVAVGAVLVMEEVGAAWESPAKRRETSVVENNILKLLQTSDSERGCLDGWSEWMIPWRRTTPGFIELESHLDSALELIQKPPISDILQTLLRSEAIHLLFPSRAEDVDQMHRLRGISF
jgi:hypothetical protein